MVGGVADGGTLAADARDGAVVAVVDGAELDAGSVLDCVLLDALCADRVVASDAVVDSTVVADAFFSD